MPRYLRWIAAITAGIVALFVYSGIVLGAAAGTGHKTLHGGIGFLVTFLGQLIPVLVSLAINDWLRERYGLDPKRAKKYESERTP